MLGDFGTETDNPALVNKNTGGLKGSHQLTGRILMTRIFVNERASKRMSD